MRPPRRRLSAPIVCLVLASLLAPTFSSAATPEQVDASIKKAVQYIYSQQKGGHWELVGKPEPDGAVASVKGRQWGGVTALAVYGLLSAGENPQDPRVEQGIQWLIDNQITGIYAAGIRAQVWPLIPENSPFKQKLRAAVQRDQVLFLRGIHQPNAPYLPKPKVNTTETRRQAWVDPRVGFYGYFVDPKSGKIQEGWYDRSVSQYGVLGMWACEQAGAEVPEVYWKLVDAAWKRAQQPDGGWNYQNDKEVTATMTAAGVATLFITQDYLMGDQGPCRGNVTNPQLERGLAWMDRHIAGAVKGGSHYYYLMYGIERIGVASGRKYFGTFDWYAHGADELVKKQNKAGYWGNPDEGHNPKGIADTVFATVFLVRGRAPVVMNKLEYASVSKEKDPTGWNQRPRDVANFTHWMSRQSERFYNWQIVNLKVPAEELLDSPILYVAGSDQLAFKPEEEAKLKQYVEMGGMILGNADCGKDRFARSFVALGQKLFPGYEFRDLEANHPIFTREQFNLNRGGKKIRVMALSNGVRELMLLVPNEDIGRWWQSRADRTKEESFQLGANIFLYSVEKQNARVKGQTHFVKDKGQQPARTVKVARLQTAGNWDPEPGGWRRLAAILKNDHKLGVEVETVKLGEGKLVASGAKLAHLTGTAKFMLTSDQRKELKEFVNAGGTLLIEAAGGSTDFADAAERELISVSMFGDAAVKAITRTLPAEHPLFHQGKGAVIEEVNYRLYGKPTLSGRQPRLRAIEVNGRPAVFFSREDLSAGMVGQPVDAILGYDPDSATALVRNLVLFVANGGKAVPAEPPTTQPADKKPAAPVAAAAEKK